MAFQVTAAGPFHSVVNLSCPGLPARRIVRLHFRDRSERLHESGQFELRCGCAAFVRRSPLDCDAVRKRRTVYRYREQRFGPEREF
jgi:hypothetical protein